MPRSPEPAGKVCRRRVQVCTVKALFRAVSLLACLVSACGGDRPGTSEQSAAAELVVYADRDTALIQPVLDAYTAETGIPVRLTADNGQALIDRLTEEKHQATADLFLAGGVSYLWAAVEQGLLRPTDSKTLENGMPDNLRDPEKVWFALLVRARIIAYDKRVVNPDQLTGYAGLGDDRWRKKLCLSSSADTDNQVLVALLIKEHGRRATELIVRRWIANLATPVLAGDTRVLQAIEDGPCELGIVNSNEVARRQRDRPAGPLASFWPRATSGGAHINILGAAVSRHANNPAGARRILEWLWSDTGQKLLAGHNLEHPANADTPADASLPDWHDRPISPIKLAAASYYLEDAAKLMERAHYARSD